MEKLKEEVEFLRRLPGVIAPELRFVLDGIETSLFSIEALHRRAVATLSCYDAESLFSMDRYTRSNVFSDIWGMVDNAYATIQLLKKFAELKPPQQNSDETKVKSVGLGEDILKKIRGYLELYESDIGSVRNMMDHLHQNIQRVSRTPKTPPIQGGLSYFFCTVENYLQKKAFIVTLTNNAFVQEKCTISAPNPIDKETVPPIDHIILSALDKTMKTRVLDISKLYRDSAQLRKFLNISFEKALIPELEKIAKEENIARDKILECNAHTLTVVADLSFDNNEQKV